MTNQEDPFFQEIHTRGIHYMEEKIEDQMRDGRQRLMHCSKVPVFEQLKAGIFRAAFI